MPVCIVKSIHDPFGTSRRSEEGRKIQRSPNYVEGWWENIAPRPIYIKSKAHLKEVCLAESKRTGRTIIPRMFAKPKSQGKGFEWSY